MSLVVHPPPFSNCPALDGSHCETASLAKIYQAYGHPLSEEMLFGVGAGIGFIYWQMKMSAQPSIFIGGRGNTKKYGFFTDLGRRTGVVIRPLTTSSAARAEAALLDALAEKKPVMLGGDMGFLPWFHFPEEYHFGGHSFVICGYDGDKTLLASDLDQEMSGCRKGYYAPITLEQLRLARGSKFKPFPPRHLRYEFDFRDFHAPRRKDILYAIAQAADVHLNPPIQNIGISGMRHSARQILTWPGLFDVDGLRRNLFNLYIFLEIGGTGGGCFRAMYAHFLEEAAVAASLPELAIFAAAFHASAQRFTRIALLFQDARTAPGLEEKIKEASNGFAEIADLEETAWCQLAAMVSRIGAPT